MQVLGHAAVTRAHASCSSELHRLYQEKLKLVVERRRGRKRRGSKEAGRAVEAFKRLMGQQPGSDSDSGSGSGSGSGSSSTTTTSSTTSSSSASTMSTSSIPGGSGPPVGLSTAAVTTAVKELELELTVLTDVETK